MATNVYENDAGAMHTQARHGITPARCPHIIVCVSFARAANTASRTVLAERPTATAIAIAVASFHAQPFFAAFLARLASFFSFGVLVGAFLVFFFAS
jgi:hypothetical protein